MNPLYLQLLDFEIEPGLALLGLVVFILTGIAMWMGEWLERYLTKGNGFTGDDK